MGLMCIGKDNYKIEIKVKLFNLVKSHLFGSKAQGSILKGIERKFSFY
jgi:hypothetical protein